MTKTTLTVLIPVLNGASQLRQAVESLEMSGTVGASLVISDNGSTDQTREVAGDLARKQAISLLARDSTMPVLEHFRAAVVECVTPYVFLLAHDDQVSSGFLREALQLLNDFEGLDGLLPNVVNVCSGGRQIPIQSSHDYMELTQLSSRSIRLFMSRRLPAVNGIYGIWRRSVLLESLDQVVAKDDLLNPLTDRSLIVRLLLGRKIQPMGRATLLKSLPENPSNVLSILQRDVGFDQVASVLKSEIPPRSRALAAYLHALRVQGRVESRVSRIRNLVAG